METSDQLCIRIAQSPPHSEVWNCIRRANLNPELAEVNLKNLFFYYGTTVPFDMKDWHEGRTFLQLAIMNEGGYCG